MTNFASLLLMTITVVTAFFLSSCSPNQETQSNKIRLGYLLNITHAMPIVGIESGLFSNIEPYHFTSGGTLLSSLISRNLDIAYIGPGPFINALAKQIDLELLSVSCYGANSLVLAKNYQQSPNDFVIHKIAVPQFGNTQDLLAKMLIRDSSDKIFAKEIEYIAVNPAELETAFFIGNIDAALVSEPWGTLLEAKGFATHNQILDQINSYPTTILVVRKEFKDKHPELLEQFLKEEKQIQALLQNDQAKSIGLIKAHLERITKKKFTDEILLTSFNKVVFNHELNTVKLNELAELAFEAKYFRHKFKI